MSNSRAMGRSIAAAVGLAVMAAAVAAPARAEQTPLPDKPFAEHRIVLQLSDDDPKKQRLVSASPTIC